MSTNVNQLKTVIEQANKVLVIGHENPDGDTVGSVLGLYGLLKKMNKQVYAVFPNDVPEFLKWLPFFNECYIYTKSIDIINPLLTEMDLIIGLDFNEVKRTGKLSNEFKKIPCTKLIIDHHPHPETCFNIIISEIEVSSTAELLYQQIELLNWTRLIDKDIATCIFTGIMTDTLSFNVNAHRPATYETAAKLLQYNLDKNEIHHKLFNSFSEQRMRLLGYALHQKMKVLHEWNTAYMWLNKDELKHFCFQIGDSEGMVNYPLSIKGIKLAALFLEKENYIKISMRSIGNIPVNEIMKNHFVGGGHKNAAGGEEYELSLEETLRKFENILPLYKTYLWEK